MRKMISWMLVILMLFVCQVVCAEDAAIGKEPVSVQFIEELIPEEETLQEEIISDPIIPEDLQDGKAVIGKDDRIIITNPGQYPYSAIALIDAEGTCGCMWNGTGFMISDRWMLTAGHCMYCTEHLKPIKYASFFFGYENERNYLLYQDAGCTIWVSKEVQKGGDFFEDDYAFVRFDNPIGNKTGSFAYRFNATDRSIEAEQFFCVGYRAGLLKSDYDWMTVLNEKFVAHTIDMESGNSGCPLFDKNYRVVAINTAHSIDNISNYGVRLTNEIYRLMQSAGFPR